MSNVIIIGGGPVGMALAVALSRYGIKSTVIEKRKEPTPIEESRAIVWMPKGIEFLEWINLLDEFKKNAVVRTMHQFRIHGHKLINLDLKYADSKFKYSLNLPQYYSEYLFEKEALKHPEHIDIMRGYELMDLKNNKDEVIATIKNNVSQELKNVTGAFLIGCDGAKSKTRELADIKLNWHDYGTFSAVADIEASIEQDTTFSWIELNPRRPIGLFNFHPNKWRITYRVNSNETREQAGTEAFARNIIGEYFPFIKNYKILWVSCFRLGQGQSESYFKNRIILAGDAAHPMGPSAGAGMMVGMLGVWRMAFRVKDLINEKNPYKIKNILTEYQSDQIKGSEMIQKANKTTFEQIAFNKRFLGALRNILLKVLSFFPSVKRKIIIADTLTNQQVKFTDYK